MTTARDIIEAASRKIHVLGRGQVLSAEEAKDALSALNAMLGVWSVEGGYVFTETSEAFTLTSAKTYTIGSGGDFDTVRPVNINSAYVTSGTTDYSLGAMDQTAYSSIASKDTQGIPTAYYYDADYPLANITLYPRPAGVSTITLNSVKPLTSFTSLTTSFNMPPEYEEALIYNLAVRLAPDYEKEASPSVREVANMSKSAVFTANTRNDELLMVADNAVLQLGTRFNIYTGGY